MINFEGKKVLVRPSQAETTTGKSVVIGESRTKGKSKVKKLKPTFDELLAKYKEGKARQRATSRPSNPK